MIIIEENDIIAVQLTEYIPISSLEIFEKELKSLLKIEVIFIPVGMSLEVYRKNYEQN